MYMMIIPDLTPSDQSIRIWVENPNSHCNHMSLTDRYHEKWEPGVKPESL